MIVRYNGEKHIWVLRHKNIILATMTEDAACEYANNNDKEYLAACAMLYGVEVQRLNFAMDALKEEKCM